MMEYTKLCEKIEKRIAICREKYEKDRKDPFMSHIRNSELETLETLYDRIQKEGVSAALQADLKDRLARQEEAKDREEAAPSFSWYGEHYHYLVLDGECNAYRSMIELLEESEK